MQLANFKIFLSKVISEGNRLQRYDINGTLLTKKKFTQTQKIALIISMVSLCVLHKGFSNDFAGYIISFLGIFVGLFSSIVISMYDKRASLYENFREKDEIQQTVTLHTKNYVVQFTGLTSYAILIAIVLIILLSLVLLHEVFQIDVRKYYWISSVKELNLTTLINFGVATILYSHRFFVTYLLLNFFTITLYSISGYFSFLLSEYKRIKLKDDQFK